MMQDKQISASCVAAWAMWAAAVSVWGLAWYLENVYVGQLGLMLSAGAATTTIRTYFIGLGRRIRHVLTITGREPEDESIRLLR